MVNRVSFICLGVGAAVDEVAMDEASISISIMQELAKYENAEREVQRLQWIIMENESNDEKEILKSHFEVVKTFVREMLQASDKERALEVVKKVRRTSDQGVQKFKLEPLRFPIGAANEKTRCYVYMKGSKDDSWNLNCSVILQSIANGEDSTRITKVLCRCSHGFKISSTGTGQYLYVCAAASSARSPCSVTKNARSISEFVNNAIQAELTSLGIKIL
ncbi:predicted protein [Arabidopsis lyrata subsp. lyrata]|uniref:Predicted protein n=1 Tax=Arabidopsis lyrata subsp. lyrata TaxID=81972 RepID=D7KVH1_ARALL|nr:predicted protein [Arabidopsis lyrata subsp. lyrata]